jgi:predicted Zn-dependent protease
MALMPFVAATPLTSTRPSTTIATPRAIAYAGGKYPPEFAIEWLDRAVAGNPMHVAYHIQRAGVRAQIHDPAALDDLHAAVMLDPNDAGTRLLYARALVQFNRPADAIDQYRIALAMNDQLDKAEPKRLSAAEIAVIEKEMQSARDAATQPHVDK